jgi:hypothetical protein
MKRVKWARPITMSGDCTTHKLHRVDQYIGFSKAVAPRLEVYRFFDAHHAITSNHKCTNIDKQKVKILDVSGRRDEVPKVSPEQFRQRMVYGIFPSTPYKQEP